MPDNKQLFSYTGAMAFISFLLNLPWTGLAFVLALLSAPTGVAFHRKPFTILISVKGFWWQSWLPSQRGVRAMTMGSVVLLGRTLEHDLEHELVHIEQYQLRQPGRRGM